MENAIWYVPKHNSWAVGSLGDIGGEVHGIASTDGSGYSNNSYNNPINVPSNEWWYANNGWKKPNNTDDIIVQCDESKY